MAVSTLSGLIWRTEPAWVQRGSRVAALRRGWLRPARLCEPQLHRPFCEVRPRRAPHAPLKRRPRQGRRFLKESRYSLSVQADEACGAQNELHELRASAAGGFGPRDPKGSQEHSPKLAPVLRPVSASLRLRYRSAAFSRALRDSSIFGSRRNR